MGQENLAELNFFVKKKVGGRIFLRKKLKFASSEYFDPSCPMKGLRCGQVADAVD